MAAAPEGAEASVELAPALVARVAAFPLRLVAELADPELAALARASGPKDMSPGSAYSQAYAAAIERARARLWAATADDPRFMRALVLSNPELAASVASTRREPRTKRVRHRETSLYRHLARAVARPEPSGLWAGVALARFGEGEGLRCAAAPARCAFAPDLAPFVALFAALAERPECRAIAPYKLNPTLCAHEGGHRFRVPDARGTLQAREIAPSRPLGLAIAALGRGPVTFTLAEAEALLRAAGFPHAPIAGLLGLLREQGVLVGGLRFPTAPGTPWDALAAAAARLPAALAAPWEAATADLRARCERLDRLALERGPAELAAELAAARQVVVDLAAALGVACPELPRTALRCDAVAPVALTFGQDLRDLFSAIVAEFGAFLAHLGMGGALSPALIERWLGARGHDLAAFAPPPPLRAQDALTTWEGLGEELGPELAARARAWAERLTAGERDEFVAPPQPDTAGAWPLGSLLFSLGGDLVGRRLVLRGLVRDATPAFARCAHVLGPAGDDLTRWLVARFERVAEATGVDAAELRFLHPNANVLARPRLVPFALDLWGADPDALDLRGARVEPDPLRGAPVCRLPGRARPLAVYTLTAALVPPGDPCQHLLLLSSMRTPPQIPRGDRLGFHAELRSGRHAPRVTLPSGHVVRTRRSALVEADLRALTGAEPGPARFAAWQRLAAARGWPPLVLVHRDDEPPLLVPRDAPLAVEAMTEGAAACQCLTVEEFADDACVPGPDGPRVVELSLPFVRPRLLARLRAALAAVEPDARPA